MKIILKGKENVYEQIVNEYKRYITLNVLRFDEKLPSCRALACQLGINPNTVQRAYAVLEEEGFIKSLPKKGAYVCYNPDNSKSNLGDDIKKYILEIKNQNVSYDELISIIKEVYGGEN